MTLDDFTLALESELRLLGTPCDQGDLLAFAASVWPLAEDEPDPADWARVFLRARQEAGAVPPGPADLGPTARGAMTGRDRHATLGRFRP